MSIREEFRCNLTAILDEKGLLWETEWKTAKAVCAAWTDAAERGFVRGAISRETVRSWLYGKALPQVRLMDALADFLDCVVSDLIDTERWRAYCETRHLPKGER